MKDVEKKLGPLMQLQELSKSTEEKLTHSLARVPTLRDIAANLDKDTQHIPLLPRLGSNASLEELANPDITVGKDIVGAFDDGRLVRYR